MTGIKDEHAAECALGALVPGRKPVRELLLQEPGKVEEVLLEKGLDKVEASRIVDLCKRSRVRFSFLERERLDAVCRVRHQGVVAKVFAPGYADLGDMLRGVKDAPLPVLLALDQLQDPGNVGTLARTLWGLGGGGLIVCRHGAAALGPGAAKASAGTLTRLPVAVAGNLSRALELAGEAGCFIYGAVSGGTGRSVFEAPLALPAVLVLGNEDKGLRPGVAKRCDELVSIPMARPLDSINVAQAGAILLGRFLGQALGAGAVVGRS